MRELNDALFGSPSRVRQKKNRRSSVVLGLWRITALGHEPHHHTIFYVDVDDVGAYLEKAKSLGGKMLVPQVINAFHSEGARGRFRRIVGYQERADKAQAFGNRENRAPRLHDHEGCA